MVGPKAAESVPGTYTRPPRWGEDTDHDAILGLVRHQVEVTHHKGQEVGGHLRCGGEADDLLAW